LTHDSTTPFAGRGGSTVDSHSAAGGLEGLVREAFQNLPVPLLARNRNGSVLFANEAALGVLRLSAEELYCAQVTRVQGAGAGGRDEPESFLLSVDQTLQRRVRARSGEIELERGGRQEVLVLEELDRAEGPELQTMIQLLERKSDAVQQAANTLLWNHVHQKPDRWNQSARRLKTRVRELKTDVRRLAGISLEEQTFERMAWIAPRLLFADVVRRVRRHLSPGVPFRLHLDHDLLATGRLARVDPVDVAQLVLTGLDLLSAGASGGGLFLRATEAGCRLRMVVDASGLAGAEEPPDLRSRQAVTRELTPILRNHQATFEVHRDGHGHHRVVLTLPTHPPGDASPDSPGTSLPIRKSRGL